MAILISDANPVQFWRADCLTWNESDPEGVFHRKFCQPWNCDDTIKVEFSDALSDDANFQPVSFPALSAFQTRSVSSSLVNWTTGASPSVTLGFGVGFGQTSEILYVTGFTFIPGYKYRVTINFTTDSTGPGSLTARMYNNTFNAVAGISQQRVFNAATTWSLTLEFTATSETQIFGVVASCGPSGVTMTLNSNSAQRSVPDEYHLAIHGEEDEFIAALNFSVTVISTSSTSYGLYQVSFSPEDLSICDKEIYLKIMKSTGSPDIEVAKSDGLDIRTSHSETVLITYSNHRNFAGLYYSSVSPDQEFYIRIPAVFIKERFPQEGEDMQLSSNRVIALNSQMKVQRRLSTGKMPFYMHRKMVLILQHQTLYIDGQYWVKGSEVYEQIESQRTDPTEKYFVWLTLKDYVVRNIL